MCREFIMVRLRGVNKGISPKSLEVGDVRFVSAPGFFQGYVVEGMCGGDIVDMCGIAEGIEPVALGKVSIE